MPRPQHRTVGDAIGVDGEVEVEETLLECPCGKVQTAVLPSDAPAKEAIAMVSCVSCGHVGKLRMWKAPKDSGRAA